MLIYSNDLRGVQSSSPRAGKAVDLGIHAEVDIDAVHW
jgi:hypothetical protein